MFTRLFIVLLVLATTVSVCPSAHAENFTAYVTCHNTGGYTGVVGYATFQCVATVSGGTGVYTSADWDVSYKYYTTPTNVLDAQCRIGRLHIVSVVITGNAGNTGEGNTSFVCLNQAD